MQRLPRRSPGAEWGWIPARFITYFFDDPTIRDPGDLKRIRDAAARQLGALRPDDRAAIFTASCRVELDFTNDRLKLQEAVSRLELHPVLMCRASGNQILQVKLLKTVVNKSSLPARRDIILVSSGFVLGQFSSQETDLIATAIHSKVSIDAVDVGESTDYTGGGAASGMDTSRAPRYDKPTNPLVLIDLAHGTGGTLSAQSRNVRFLAKYLVPSIFRILPEQSCHSPHHHAFRGE